MKNSDKSSIRKEYYFRSYFKVKQKKTAEEKREEAFKNAKREERKRINKWKREMIENEKRFVRNKRKLEELKRQYAEEEKLQNEEADWPEYEKMLRKSQEYHNTKQQQYMVFEICLIFRSRYRLLRRSLLPLKRKTSVQNAISRKLVRLKKRRPTLQSKKQRKTELKQKSTLRKRWKTTN